MHEIDRVLKVLSGRFPHVFLKLLFGDRTDDELVALEDTQLNIPEYRSDKIFRLRHDRRETILNLEFMVQPRKRMLGTFLIKTALLMASYSLPVVTVIVYLERGRYRSFPEVLENQLLGFRNRFVLDKILLWEHRELIASGELLELAPLLPLLYDRPGIDLLEKERQLILQIPDRQHRSDLLALAMMVAFRKYEAIFVREFFKKEYLMLKESTFVQEWIKEGRKEGREEGREEGKKEGKKEGLEEGIEYGKLALLLHLVRTKFKAIEADLESQLKQLKSKQIDDLSAQLFAMEQVEELAEWLSKNKPSTMK